ncbi:hypothetical protein ACNI3K_07990 [Demequina sp. SO4-13]|uniref:hypothetical protein n=1 Tax=Demequina sp. SO4-13 TaxID=3401027 RepID=UPI003AF6A1B4
MRFGRLTMPQRISGVAILVVIVAAFLPWVSIPNVSRIGIETGGITTLALALAGAVVLIMTSGVVGRARTPGSASQKTLLVLAMLVALVGLLNMSGTPAIGVYVTLLGGIAWTAGAVWQLSASGKGRMPRGFGPQGQD